MLVLLANSHELAHEETAFRPASWSCSSGGMHSMIFNFSTKMYVQSYNFISSDKSLVLLYLHH